MKRLIVGLVAAVVLFGVHEANAIIINGDFETGDLTGWTWTPDIGSEPTMVATVAPFSGSNAFRVNPGNDSGDGVTYKGGTLSQSVSLVGGVAYDVVGSLLAIRDLGGSANRDGGRITVSLAGDLLHTFQVGRIDASATVTDSFDVQYTPVSSGSVPLQLRFTRSYKNFSPVIYHYADDLSISTVVPEPTTLAIWGILGGIGLAVGYRRRKA